MTFAEVVASSVAGGQSARLTTGQYALTNPDGTVMVDFGQGLVRVYSAGFYAPLPGEYVRCLVAGLTLMLGPVKPRPAYGTVTATGSPRLDVLLPDGSTVSLPRLSSYTNPAVNDEVTILWANGGIVLGDQDDTPASTYQPPATSDNGAAPRKREVGFKATDSGSQTSGTDSTGSGNYWTSEVRCGATTLGGWFYDGQIERTIPNNARIDSIKIYIPEISNRFPSSLATLGTHTALNKSSDLDVSGAHEIARGTGWRELPVAYGELLKTGAAKGIATNHGGDHIFQKVRGPEPSTAQSGRLLISYTV